MNSKDKLTEATVKILTNNLKESEEKQTVKFEGKYNKKRQLTEANHKDEKVENELDKIYEDLITKIKAKFPDSETVEQDWTNQGYKHRLDIKTPKIKVRENTYRYILIDIFYNIPSFPSYDYYLGAKAEIVETSSNDTSVAGLKSSGYEVKNEIPNTQIAMQGYAEEELKNKGQTVEEFIESIINASNKLNDYNMKRFS